MLWKTDRGIIRIESYITIVKLCSKLQFSQVREATTIIRDPFNCTNNHPLYTIYQNIQGEQVIRSIDSS